MQKWTEKLSEKDLAVMKKDCNFALAYDIVVSPHARHALSAKTYLRHLYS